MIPTKRVVLFLGSLKFPSPRFKTARTLSDTASINTLIAAFTIISCIVILIQIGTWLERTVPTRPLDLPFLAQKFDVPFIEFRPEPIERLQYITATFLFIPLCIACYWFYRQLFSMFTNRLRGCNLIAFTWTLIMPVLLVILTWIVMRRVDNIYFQFASFIRRPKSTATIFLFFLLGMWLVSLLLKRRGIDWLEEILFFVPGLGLIFLMVLERIINETDSYSFTIHFQAYYDAVVQTFLGKVVLVNINTQYGLYPTFLSPMFQLLHRPTVFAFTLLMSLLTGIAYFCLLLLLRLALHNRVVAFCGFVTIAFYTRIAPPLYLEADPYFQYWPHRLLFPLVFVLLAWFYLIIQESLRQKLLFIILSVVCALSILWSPDSGIVVFGAWCFLLFLQELLQLWALSFGKISLNIARHIGIALLTVAFLFLLVTLYLYILSGKLPDWAGMAEYMNLFYGNGYFMLPIPTVIYPWVLLILCYMAALYQVICHVFEQNQASLVSSNNLEEIDSNRIIMKGVLAVLGVGLFSYYQGRSHDYNLIHVSWPALLLLAFFTDDLLVNLKRKLSVRPLSATTVIENTGYALQFIVFFFFLFSSLPSVILNLPGYTKIIQERQAEIRAGASVSLVQQIQFIRANTSSEDQVLILSDNAPALSLYSGFARPIDIPGFGELALVRDVNQVINFLDHPPKNAKVFWEPTFDRFTPSTHPALQNSGSTPLRNLFLFIPKE